MIQQAFNCYLLLEPLKTSMLPILSKDLSKSAIFERFEIFKMIKTKTSKNTIGKSVSTEILPKIKKE